MPTIDDAVNEIHEVLEMNKRKREDAENPNIADRVNDFLCEVREHDGFANDKNFDRVAAEVFKIKIKALIEECANIAADMKAEVNQRPEKRQYGRTPAEVAEYIENEIRALDS
jgi:uncharacterized protein (DUF2267 family)